MPQRRPNHKPSFFWQGLLILLPVAVLTVFGAMSLVQDEQTVEREARKRAEENAQILANNISASVFQDLVYYVTAQNVWIYEVRLAANPATPQTNSSGESLFPSTGLKAATNKWEAIFPNIRIEDQPVGVGRILATGRALDPPDSGVSPAPPEWFNELEPRQRELWEKMRNAEAGDSKGGELELIRKAFLQTAPGNEARAAAQCLGSKPEEILSRRTSALSESGAPFEDIACYRLLSDSRHQIDSLALDVLWRRVAESPSFFTPALLDLAEKESGRSNRLVHGEIERMHRYWEAENRTRGWLDPLCRLPELKTHVAGSGPWARWISGPSGEALALLEPTEFKSKMKDDPNEPPTGPGFTVWFFPRNVIEAVFKRALDDNRPLVPEFTAPCITVEEKTLIVAGGLAGKPIIAASVQNFGPADTVTGKFQVSFYLASREKMLATARKRSRTFGALIFVAAISALVGFFAARRAFRQQVYLSEQKSNFVSSVSHELRAPIASVRLLAEGLERGRVQEPEKQKEYFHFITQECRRLSSLIENVLDFARIEQGRKEYEIEPGDLAALTRETAKLMQTYADERRVLIKLQCPDGTIAVEMDGKAMQQALVNLIDNAVKHSPKGSEVTVGLESQNSAAHLWVEDRGEGIAAAEHERIFERFYRLGSELRRETQGVGIGLSIVKHIVEAHDGRVIVRSAPGQGSRFTIELPMKHE